MRNVRSAVVVSCITGTLFVTPARSQTFSGVITDSAGHPIPGAEARLASMDARTVAAVMAGANGAFSVTAPRTGGGPRRYYAELCAPGFAPAAEVVPMAPGDTLRVRGGLKKGRTRIAPMGTGACAWDFGGHVSITGGRGFGLVAAPTSQMVDSILYALPHTDSARASALRALQGAWLHRLRRSRDAASRERAAWVLLQFVAFAGATSDATTLATIRQALPPTSPWWQAASGSSPLLPVGAAESIFGVESRDTSTATLAARRSARAYIATITAAKHDPDVDAQVRHELALFALGMRDTAAANAMAKALIATYPGYTAARLAMFRLPWVTPLRAGNQMPPFDFAALGSSPQTRVTNRDLRAPYTLLVFWGTWCEQCLKELPQLDSLRLENPAQRLDILSVAADDSPEVVSDFIRAHGMPWRHAYAGTTEDPHLQRLGVFGYPTAVVVDSMGTIRASHVGFGDLRAMIAPFVEK